MDPTRGKWIVDFTCPHCGNNTYIDAEQYCPVTNSVEEFEVTGYEKDQNGKFIQAESVNVEWGKSEIGEPDAWHEQYYCGYCHELVDDEIDGTAELFNWLYERGMVSWHTSKSSTG